MTDFIYLDGHATTPLAPEAEDAMRRLWRVPGNPASPHLAGQRAAVAVEHARHQVAKLIGASASEITFTSGATESNNLALLGVARAAARGLLNRNVILTTGIEHKSVLAAAEALESEGFEVRYLPVTREGVVDLDAIDAVLDRRTLLLSVGAANGEVGAVQPLQPIVSAARAVGALVHSDLAQLAGKLPVDVGALDLDYASLSSHKIYGPAGIGAFFASAGVLTPAPLLFGGGQERGLRPGTVPAPLAAGFGAAAAVAGERQQVDADAARQMAGAFLQELSKLNVTWRLNGPAELRLPGSLSIQLPLVAADSVVERLLSRVALSTGSACQSGQVEPSHVLKAIGLTRAEQTSTIRLYFGRYNTLSDARVAAGEIAKATRAEGVADWTLRPVASPHA